MAAVVSYPFLFVTLGVVALLCLAVVARGRRPVV